MTPTSIVSRETVFAATVETASQLEDALDHCADVEYPLSHLDLTTTYRVELIDLVMSDGSITRQIRIREAEAV